MVAQYFAGESVRGFIMFHNECINNIDAPALLIEMFNGGQKCDQGNPDSIANGDHNQVYIPGWANLRDGDVILTSHCKDKGKTTTEVVLKRRDEMQNQENTQNYQTLSD